MSDEASSADELCPPSPRDIQRARDLFSNKRHPAHKSRKAPEFTEERRKKDAKRQKDAAFRAVHKRREQCTDDETETDDDEEEGAPAVRDAHPPIAGEQAVQLPQFSLDMFKPVRIHDARRAQYESKRTCLICYYRQKDPDKIPFTQMVLTRAEDNAARGRNSQLCALVKSISSCVFTDLARPEGLDEAACRDIAQFHIEHDLPLRVIEFECLHKCLQEISQLLYAKDHKPNMLNAITLYKALLRNNPGRRTAVE